MVNSYKIFLKKYFGIQDTMESDFKKIDNNTTIDDFDFTLTRGNPNLIKQNIKLPSESEKEIESYLSMELP
jgi:hypothetical protein